MHSAERQLIYRFLFLTFAQNGPYPVSGCLDPALWLQSYAVEHIQTQEATMRWQDLTTLTKSAVLSAILGFILRMPFTGISENAETGATDCSHMDFAALCMGGIAMALGATGAVKTRDLTQARGVNAALCLAVVAIGFFHMLRGLGLVWSACTGL